MAQNDVAITFSDLYAGGTTIYEQSLKKTRLHRHNFFFFDYTPFYSSSGNVVGCIHSIYQFVHLKGELNNIKIILLYRNDNVFKSWRIHMINGGVLLIKQSKKGLFLLK